MPNDAAATINLPTAPMRPRCGASDSPRTPTMARGACFALTLPDSEYGNSYIVQIAVNRRLHTRTAPRRQRGDVCRRTDHVVRRHRVRHPYPLCLRRYSSESNRARPASSLRGDNFRPRRPIVNARSPDNRRLGPPCRWRLDGGRPAGAWRKPRLAGAPRA